MSKKTATISVINEAKYPIAEIAVIHWQEDGVYKNKPTSFLSQYEKGKELNLSFSVDYDDSHGNYWAVAFRNMHDPALQYLVTKPTFWQTFAKDVMKKIDDAIGDAIDVCTESPAGTAWAVAANTAVQAIYNTAGGDARINNDIHTDTGELNIHFKCDRENYEFISHNHRTMCSSKNYYLNNYCDKTS